MRSYKRLTTPTRGEDAHEFYGLAGLEKTGLRFAKRSISVACVDPLTERQLDLLGRSAALDPPVRILGGYAEDALLAGTLTRPHVDVDWIFPRSEYDLRLAQARELGFDEFDVRGESAAGRPFYLHARNGDLELEVGVVDDDEAALWLTVGRLGFDIGGEPASAGYRIELPHDTFEHPAAAIDGVTVWPASPLALYQLRVGIAQKGSFGELGEKQLQAMRALKARFFPELSDEDLIPRIEPLTQR